MTFDFKQKDLIKTLKILTHWEIDGSFLVSSQAIDNVKSPEIRDQLIKFK